jgi:hypothetical protein
VRRSLWFSGTVAALLCVGPAATAAEKKAPRDVMPSFGSLQSPTAEAARKQAEDWLASVGKTDAASKARFAAIWNADRPLLDKVTETLILGDKNAADLLAEARDANKSAPEKLPAILKDQKVSPYLRANLGLAYARALTQRKVYEEALDALKAVKAEQVVDPATYFFTRAVCEYTLMLKKECDESVLRLLDDVLDAPERYRMVAALMHFDMLAWQDRDLGWVSRKMGVIRDRLELTRGGEKTRKMQRDVLARLEEMIKELENKAKNKGGS